MPKELREGPARRIAAGGGAVVLLGLGSVALVEWLLASKPVEMQRVQSAPANQTASEGASA